MAAGEVTTIAKPSTTPYQLDQSQTTQACKVLLKHISEERQRREAGTAKPNMLTQDAESSEDEQAEDEQTPIWLILTTKKHIVDQKRLKPNKIPLPHPIHTATSTTICLITADPSSTYTAVISHANFPAPLRTRITKTLSLTNLKKQYSTFESRRALLASHDIFLADDRVITYLPKLLGKIFYKGGAKRPIPVSIAAPAERIDGKRVKLDPASGRAEKQKHKDEGKERGAASPEAVAREIEKALSCALVHLAPGTSTAVKVARAGMSAEQVNENVVAVTNALVEKFVTGKWRNVRAIHVKGPESMAFPIWMADELWADEADVLEEKKAFGKGKTAKRIEGADGDFNMVEGVPGEGRKRKADEIKKPTEARHAKKKRKVELEAKMADETKLRKERLKKSKEEALAATA